MFRQVVLAVSSMYNLNSQFSCRATQTSHTRHQPLGPNNESNRDVTHKTSTTVSDNDNTETSHTRHQPLGPDNDNTQTSHTRHQPLGPDNDSNTYITYKRTTTLSDNDSNTDVTHKTTTTVSDNDNTETSHTRQQPLCLTMTTQRGHTQDNNHCV